MDIGQGYRIPCCEPVAFPLYVFFLWLFIISHFSFSIWQLFPRHLPYTRPPFEASENTLMRCCSHRIYPIKGQTNKPGHIKSVIKHIIFLLTFRLFTLYVMGEAHAHLSWHTYGSLKTTYGNWSFSMWIPGFTLRSLGMVTSTPSISARLDVKQSGDRLVGIDTVLDRASSK